MNFLSYGKQLHPMSKSRTSSIQVSPCPTSRPRISKRETSCSHWNWTGQVRYISCPMCPPRSTWKLLGSTEMQRLNSWSLLFAISCVWNHSCRAKFHQDWWWWCSRVSILEVSRPTIISRPDSVLSWHLMRCDWPFCISCQVLSSICMLHILWSAICLLLDCPIDPFIFVWLLSWTNL